MKLLGAVILIVGATAVLLYAQDYELLLEGNYADFQQLEPQTPQNHEFTFVRLIYNGRIQGYLKNWYTDYPKGDIQLIDMLNRMTSVDIAPELAEWVKNTILTVDATAAAHAVAAMRERPDRTNALSNITCPTLVLSGASDATIPANESQKVAAGLPNGRFVVIDDAGHLSNLENPQAFNKAVGEFLLA